MEKVMRDHAVRNDNNSDGLGWNCPRSTKYSKETQEMLKLMMQESKLTNFQQRLINNKLKKGGALPLTCNPTSSASPPQPKPKVVKSVPFFGKPQLRSAERCQAGDNYTRERFRPSATRDLEKEKRRLQNLFATGQDDPPAHQCRRASKDAEEESKERDRFEEVMDEIEERKQFLEEMTALGQGHHYCNIINTEISQKIRELEIIDRARSEELKHLLKREGKKEGKATEEN